MISATRPLSLFDRLAMVGALFGNSMPTFWLGLVLILVFSLGLGLFPSNGMYDIRSGGGPADLLHHLVLPSITLAGVSAAILARVTRSSMLEVINREYVTTARAKGLNDRRVIWGHALKNAMLPVVTVMGVQLGYLLGGSILVETVFSWPGPGTATVPGDQLARSAAGTGRRDAGLGDLRLPEPGDRRAVRLPGPAGPLLLMTTRDRPHP